jgi:hypothetical protein
MLNSQRLHRTLDYVLDRCALQRVSDDFEESKHPRGEGGEFTSGAGSGSKPAPRMGTLTYRALQHKTMRKKDALEKKYKQKFLAGEEDDPVIRAKIEKLNKEMKDRHEAYRAGFPKGMATDRTKPQGTDRMVALNVEIENITPAQAAEFRRMLAFMHQLGGMGSSREFRVFYDGDGSARAKIKVNGRKARLEPDDKETWSHEGEQTHFGFDSERSKVIMWTSCGPKRPTRTRALNTHGQTGNL